MAPDRQHKPLTGAQDDPALSAPVMGADGYFTDWPEEAKGYGQRWRDLSWEQLWSLPTSAERAGFGYGVFRRRLQNYQRRRDEALHGHDDGTAGGTAEP